jgi:hypothetical protein
MVGFQNSPKLLQYAPTILKYVATGGVVLTSSTVCFYIGDYVTNLSILATNKYEKLTEDGKALINDLAEQVKNSQEGNVETATGNIEKYNATVAELADKLKTLPPQDLIVLTTIENTDGDNANNSMTVTTTENGNEIDGDGNTGNENEENNINVATTTTVNNKKRGRYGNAVDGDAVDGDTDENKSKATKLEVEEPIDGMDLQEETENAVDGDAVDGDKRKKRGREEGGGKKKKKGRTTQKKKKGTKGKKKASKSKKPKTKKNRKTKKKSNKK